MPDERRVDGMIATPVYEGADPVGGKVVRSVRLGILHRNEQFPHLYWQNFLSVDPGLELSAAELIAEADRAFVDLPIAAAFSRWESFLAAGLER